MPYLEAYESILLKLRELFLRQLTLTSSDLSEDLRGKVLERPVPGLTVLCPYGP